RFHPASQAISFAHQLYNGQGSPDFDVNRDRHRYQMKLDWKETPERASLELCDEMEHRALPAIEAIVDYAAHMRAPAYMGGYHPDTPSRVFVEALGYCSVGEFDRAEIRLSGFERELPEFSAAGVTEDQRYDRFPLWRMAYLLRAFRND